MRMALITAIGLIVGILGGWTMWKVVAKPPRPQAERIAEPQPGAGPRSEELSSPRGQPWRWRGRRLG